MLKKYFVLLVLIGITVTTATLHFIKPDIPCLNADDVSFGYNAYSIAMTGKDEYGTPFPARFRAFGENKLPVLAYLAAPFTKILGTSDLAIRLPLHLVGILFPLVMFAFALQLFKQKNIALIAALLTGISGWIQITTRHSHEVSLSAFWIVIALTLFLKFFEEKRMPLFLWFSFVNGLSLFTYHLGKLIQPFLMMWFIVFTWFTNTTRIKRWARYGVIFMVPILLFTYTEWRTPTNRIGNLVFYNNAGFTLDIEQRRGEDNNRLLNNKLTQGIQVVARNYFAYLSPSYLSFTGDDNPRFWYLGMSPITPTEYLLLLVGLYYLFKTKHKYRWFLVTLLLWSPASAALAWAGTSMTRNFLSIVPILTITAYGVYELYRDLRESHWAPIVAIVALGSFAFFQVTTWDFYFNHYAKRALVIRATECGYPELAQYVRSNYTRFKKFYITKEHGQPYAHLLYNLQYDPSRYQPQSRLSAPDKYGFGQVDHFDKFIFHIPNTLAETGVVYIGYPEELRSRPDFTSADERKLKTIRVGTETIFSILER